MVLRWSSVVAAFLLVGALGIGVAAPLNAQQVREFGLQVTGTAARQDAVVGGPYVAIRPSTRLRLSLAAGVGVSDQEVAGRAEFLAHFLLNPTKLRGAGFYGAGGVAAVAGPVGQGYLVLILGVEGQPGGKSGWMAEAGVGGGARLAVGYRWRRP